MITRYTREHARRAAWEKQIAKQRENALAELRARIHKLETTPLHTLPPVEPSTLLIAACAAIVDAADRAAVLTHASACARGYVPLTGAGLASALTDAVNAGWVGRDERGAIYWRDAGLTPDCPLIQLANLNSANLQATR